MQGIVLEDSTNTTKNLSIVFVCEDIWLSVQPPVTSLQFSAAIFWWY